MCVDVDFVRNEAGGRVQAWFGSGLPSEPELTYASQDMKDSPNILPKYEDLLSWNENYDSKVDEFLTEYASTSCHRICKYPLVAWSVAIEPLVLYNR